MKNKPDPALSGGSYLFIEIKKRTLKSRETIPLRQCILYLPLLHTLPIKVPLKLMFTYSSAEVQPYEI
jgi:hypothetical protein